MRPVRLRHRTETARSHSGGAILRQVSGIEGASVKNICVHWWGLGKWRFFSVCPAGSRQLSVVYSRYLLTKPRMKAKNLDTGSVLLMNPSTYSIDSGPT